MGSTFKLTALDSLKPGDVILGNPPDAFKDMLYFGLVDRMSKARHRAKNYKGNHLLIVLAVDKKKKYVWTSIVSTHAGSESLEKSKIKDTHYHLFAPISPAIKEVTASDMRVLKPIVRVSKDSVPAWANVLRKVKLSPDKNVKVRFVYPCLAITITRI